MWKAVENSILLIREVVASTLSLLALSVFAAAVLWRADAIGAALRDDGRYTVWVDLIEPAALAMLLAASCGVAKGAYTRLPPILPKTKLRHLEGDAQYLAAHIALDWSSQYGPEPEFLVRLVPLQARLRKLGIHPPEISEDTHNRACWVAFLVELRIWINLGDIRAARAYRPPTVPPAPF